MSQHHALVCIADSLEYSTVPTAYRTPSSDTSHIICDQLSIGDVRRLAHDALQKPIGQDYRVFVLIVKKLPEITQNALLKLFEEPPVNTRFYLVIPQIGMLIPTLRSRVEIKKQTSVPSQNFPHLFQEIVQSTLADRISIVARITKNKDMKSIEKILFGSELYAEEKPLQRKVFLDKIIFIRSYIKTPGASVKMLLEDLVLSLPQ